MEIKKPSRGEIWLINLNPALGREQRGIRPCLIISTNYLNHGPAELAIVVPLTSRYKGIPSHVEVLPPEGGLHQKSYIKCEDIRSVSTSARFVEHWGVINANTLTGVTYRLKMLLEL